MNVDKRAIELHLEIIGDRKAYCIFGGRPEWDSERAGYSIHKDSPKKRTEWVLRDKIVDVLNEYYKKRWTVWISLNDKEVGEDFITGVRSVSVFWFDFDAPREDKAKPATDEEKGIAQKEMVEFRKWMKEAFDAVGFVACSGNGYHIFYPIAPYELPGKNYRKEFNEKQRTFFKIIREESGINFDTATDIKRVTQPIGGLNYKIPDSPLKAYWVDKATGEYIEKARKKNITILNGILDTSIKKEVSPVAMHEHPKFEELTKEDSKLKDLYEGSWRKYDFKSRSEAEASLVTILCLNGFSDVEIRAIMQGCKIGKWQEKEESYYNVTIQKGREFAVQHPVKEREKRSKRRKELFDEDGKLIFSALLDHIYGKYKFVTTDDTEELFYYDEGIYTPAIVRVKADVESALNSTATSNIVKEVIGHLQRASYVPREEFNQFRNYLPVKNGLLNLETFTLDEFDPRKIFTYKLDVAYDPNAKCPAFKKFLSEVLKPEDIEIIQEFFGYCFYPDMPAHKTLWLYGIGRNGKTSLVNILLSLLSKETAVSIPLEELDGNHRFTVARLFGKLVNVTSEPAARKGMQSVILKKLTGSDVISAEVKNKQQTIDFVNFAKFIVLGNLFPQISDPTLAFWQRIIVIEFPYTFIGDATPNKDKDIIEKDGCAGILNWCISGLKRLRGNNFHFTESKTSDEMRLEFEKRSNPVTAFLNEICIFDSASIILKNELYARYKDYCQVEGLASIGKGELTKQLQPYPGVLETTQKIKGKSQRCWRGIRTYDKNEENGGNDDVIQKVERITKEKEQRKEKTKRTVNIDLVCTCGEIFTTEEELWKHQAVCKEFQEKQDGEARKELKQ